MNEEQRYLFDLNGYLTIPDALDADAVRRVNEAIDKGIAEETGPDMRTHRFGDLLGRDAVFREMIDNGPVADVLVEIIGDDYRLDHTYADVIRSGQGPIGTSLHGGAVPYRPSEYYMVQGSTIHSGLVAVGFNIHDVGPDDGGFGCVPGSHKSNFAFPGQWRQLADDPEVVRRVTGPAGTAIVFTEAMVHGTLPWRGSQERRTAFYKYSPAAVSWSADFYNPDDYPDLTDRQRRILESPNARYQGRSTATD